ncbi:MAG: hypothetical protein IJN10_08580 [Firmicutes bacterium]|nr:hypothetical protein [Bacillota bacterium]
MKKRIMILVGTFFLTVTTLLGQLKLPVSATESKIPPYILDTKQQCRLHINTDNELGTAGEILEIYQVGLIDATSLSLAFVLNKEFEASGEDLMVQGHAERSGVIRKLYEYAVQQKIQPTAKAILDESGSADLVLPQGAYLIHHSPREKEEGKTMIQSALVGIPGVGDGRDAWVYEMEVQLKAAQESVVTGDLQDPVLYVSLAGASVLLLGIILLARRRV